MALYLSAEQKNLKSLFANDNRYIIPYYQRHYSGTGGTGTCFIKE